MQRCDSSIQCREMAKLQESAQEPGASPPLPLDTPAMLAALARDVVATREDVAALRVNLTQLSEEVRAAHERVAPNRHRAAREVLVSTSKHLGAQWHHTIADVERDITRVAATVRQRARSTRFLF